MNQQFMRLGANETFVALRQLFPDVSPLDRPAVGVSFFAHHAAAIGAFGANGRVHVQPTIERQSHRLALIVLTVEPNVESTDFQAVRLREVVDTGKVLEAKGIVSDIRYFAGYFYVASMAQDLRLTQVFDAGNVSIYSGPARLDRTYYPSVERAVYRAGELAAVEE